MEPYWTQIGEGWEKHSGNSGKGGGSRTHFQHRRDLDGVWSHRLRGITVDDCLRDRSRWRAFEAERASHADCALHALCAGCGAGYCEHVCDRQLCLSVPVCTACDLLVDPNPYNPRCALLVAHYAAHTNPSPGLEWLLADFIRGAAPTRPAPAAAAPEDVGALVFAGELDEVELVASPVKTRVEEVSPAPAGESEGSFPKAWGWG